MSMKAHLDRSFNATLGRWRKVQDVFNGPSQIDDNDLSDLRDRVLEIFVACTLFLGLIVLIPMVILFLQSGRILSAIFYPAIYVVFIFLLMARSLNYKTKVYVILTTLGGIGIQIILTMGVFSSGPAWMFAFAVMASVLLGLKAAVLAIGFNAFLLVTLTWVHHSGLMGTIFPTFPTIETAVLAGVTFLFLNALAAFTIAALNIGFSNAVSRAQKSQNELTAEVDRHRETFSRLKQSEEKYRLLSENISDILWSLDMDLNITYANPAAEQLLGWSSEDLKRLRLEDLLTAVSLEKTLKIFANNLAYLEDAGDFNEADTLVLDIRCKDGTTVSTEVRARFIQDEDGKPIGIMGVARDISERIKAERDKELLQEKLTQSKRMEALGLLAGGVAHDLNNVLAGMVSYPDLLLFDMPMKSPMRKPLEMIRQTGHKAATIVQDLLSMTRRGVRAQGLVLLNESIEEYIASPECTELKKRYPNVMLETRLSDDLMNIKGSSMHLKKALMNLMLNAAEAQPNGGRITVRTENFHMDHPSEAIEGMEPGDYVRLTVTDEGNGIAPEDLKHIFEPFFTRKIMGRSGTGLGMAIVWGTVQDHDGFITVKSQEGIGTTFDLYFPIARETMAAERHENTVDILLGSWQTILVVDDVAEQRDIAIQILKRLRYRPLTAHSGEEAVQIFQQLKDNTIDALILDMIMPMGMDGLDTYRRILELAPNTKAIITSGYSETERVRAALELGAGAYLKKPYMIQEIGLALKNILNEPAPISDKAANA